MFFFLVELKRETSENPDFDGLRLQSRGPPLALSTIHGPWMPRSDRSLTYPDCQDPYR